MKYFIMVLLVVFMIGCSEAVTGPEDPIDPDPPTIEDTLSATVSILSWSQEYTEGTYIINGITYTKKYGDIQAIYEIQNTGNVEIENYELWFGFEAYDSTVSPIVKYKNAFKKLIKEIEVSETLQDTMIFSSYERYIPITKIDCEINALNF